MLVSCRMWQHGQELFLTSCTLRLWIGYLCRHNHREDRAIQHHLAATRHLFLHDRCAQNKGQWESSTRKLDEKKLPEVKIFNRNTMRTAEKTRGNQSINGYMTPVNSRVWIPPSSPNLFSHGPVDDHVWPWGLVPGSFGAPVRPDSTPQTQTTSKELSKLLELWRCILWRCYCWCFRNPAPPDMWMFTISTGATISWTINSMIKIPKQGACALSSGGVDSGNTAWLQKLSSLSLGENRGSLDSFSSFHEDPKVSLPCCLFNVFPPWTSSLQPWILVFHLPWVDTIHFL